MFCKAPVPDHPTHALLRWNTEVGANLAATIRIEGP